MPEIIQFDFTNISPYKTRKTLIERCKAKDPEAWLAFYRPYYNYARNVIKRSYFNIPESDIDELAHQVMIDMCEKIGNFDPEKPSQYHHSQRGSERSPRRSCDHCNRPSDFRCYEQGHWGVFR